jgi:3-dehydroquinate dehydratase / shikimate dehydrogenase
MRKPQLCVTVMADTTAELRMRRDQAAGADLVELRLDAVRDPDVAAALAGRRTPVIVTCRPVWEGGHFRGSEDERRDILQQAQAVGAEYVDVEWQAAFQPEIVRATGGRGVVISQHDFTGVPADLAARATAMRATGADIVKLAVMAHRLSDCAALLPIGRAVPGPTVLIAMGDAGLVSRVLPHRFGSVWTYAGEGAAPGQLPAARLRHEFGFAGLGTGTAIYGVVGRPVMHSVSPAMHNAAFRAHTIDAVHLPLAAADFADFVSFAEAFAVAGASVTAPFKVDAFERAAELDETSRRVRAVNTLKRTASGWAARNTDVEGFLDPLNAAIDVRGLRATVLGAGGAARAVVDALTASGARAAICARRLDAARTLAHATGAAAVAWPPTPGSWDVLVNATPVGTTPRTADSPLPGGPFDGRLVYDLVYNPPETTLLREARAAGCAVLGGLDMLVAQAQRQFEWWTTTQPDAHHMRAAAEQALGHHQVAIT